GGVVVADDELDLVGQVAERLTQHLVDLLARLAGKGTDVEVDVDLVGDDIYLRTTAHDGGGHGGVRARVGEAGQTGHRQGLAHLPEAFGPQHGLAQLGREVHGLDEPSPGGVDLGLRPVGVDAAHDLRRL